MDRAVDAHTKAIIINNPSNPCGSNFSAEHLLAIAAIARKHKLPIIADEIYGRCVFNGQFFPMHLYSGDVPVISVGGLAKEFIVPGWRVGWIIFHDKGTGRLKDYKSGVRNLTQIVLGANSLVQGAIPRLLTPAVGSKDAIILQEFMQHYMDTLRRNTAICVREAMLCPEISVIEPAGAMYMMIKIDFDALDSSLVDDTIFAQRLLAEENLIVLPGQCFSMKSFIRLVIAPPEDFVKEALQRIRLFCARYRRVPPSSLASSSTITTSENHSNSNDDKEDTKANKKARTQ